MKSDRIYIHNGWKIQGVGGFCTVRHFWADNGNLSHWAFTLRECKQFCDQRDSGGEIKALYLKPLYN